MNGTRQLEKNIDFQRSDLAHRLCRLEQFVFGDGFRSVATGGIQVDPFDELHVV